MSRAFPAAALLLLSFAAAANGPIDIKGIRPGMTLEEADTALPAFSSLCFVRPVERGGDGSKNCIHVTKSRHGNRLPALDTFAGVPTQSVFARIKGDKLADIAVDLASDHFTRVALALQEKWGKPHSETTGTIQNRAGANFDQVEMVWRSGDYILTATKRRGRVDRMSILLTTATAVREGAQELLQERPKQDAKDL